LIDSLQIRYNLREFETYFNTQEAKMAKLVDIEGVGDVYAQKLKGAGVGSTEALLKKGATPKGRQEVAEKTGISPSLILEWVNHVDLFRIKGVGEEYADLLEEAGVDTVPELAQRNPENLLEKMAAVNAKKKLVRRLPVLNQVSDWVAQAKSLPRVIQY
jgi:predicted flap endonuclease-1-like 5' DNA nuclease